MIKRLWARLAEDTRQHLRTGVPLAIACALLGAIALWSLPAAVAFGGTGACGFVEWYQRRRGNGQAELSDLVAGALPSWLLAAALWLLE